MKAAMDILAYQGNWQTYPIGRTRIFFIETDY